MEESFKFKSPKRTVTEADIINYINAVGLLEPIFIDMEYVKENVGFRQRFAPGPFIISLGMGLTSLAMSGDTWDRLFALGEGGLFAGFVELKAKLGAPVIPGDTIGVDVEIGNKRKTSKGGTLVDLVHTVKNQRGEITTEFTETILFHPPKAKA